MVFQKRLDYGFGSYQVSAMARVPKSAKGKRSVRKKFVHNQMHAFDLLATVAGKLLLEKENSSSPADIIGKRNPTSPKNTEKQGQLDEERPCKPDSFNQGSCNESTLGSETVIQRLATYPLNEYAWTPKASVSRHASVVAKSDASDRDAYAGESIIYDSKDESECSQGTSLKKRSMERHSPGSISNGGKLDDGIESTPQTEKCKSGFVTDGCAPDKCSLENIMELDAGPSTFVSSDSSVEVLLCGDRMPYKSSFPTYRDDMELDVDRDDDENSSGCTHVSTLTPKLARPLCIGDHKIRKLLTSQYQKVARSFLKNTELSNSDVEIKPGFCSKQMCYTRRRTQRSIFNRRKVFERCSIAASEGRICGKDVYNLPGMDNPKVGASESSATIHGANGASSSTTDRESSYKSGDFHVKLSIKSFRVPELLIEMPETATIGSLKRTVMEAVTAILGSGLHVGVLLQGKKVRDDSETLLQAGISHNDKLDNLGFTLEPNPTQAPPPLTCPESSHFLLDCDAARPPTRITVTPPTSEPGPPNSIPEPPLNSVVNVPERDHDSVHSTTNVSLQDKTTNSKTLVAVPPMHVEALAIVPLCKSKRAELVQRRIRRPFSVSEVEALVQAVEMLGTGRWRDVKLRAFDNAKHRTYVDLKRHASKFYLDQLDAQPCTTMGSEDKWKTLVHTARISPQQRRGEPVPQELLDRVLSAHSYWSKQQTKLQVKAQQAEACLLV